jgi:hypothetical protein
VPVFDCPCFHRADSGGDVAPIGDKNNGRILPLREPPLQFEAADVRKVDVQNYAGCRVSSPANARYSTAEAKLTILIMEPRFLARSLEDTAHLKDVELTTHWNLRDRHIRSLVLALHADLEDGSPAGPLYGESLGLALGVYLVRRYSVRNCVKPDYCGSMPTARMNRTLEFINQNLAQDLRLWELAQIAGMSPNYFVSYLRWVPAFSLRIHTEVQNRTRKAIPARSEDHLGRRKIGRVHNHA